MAKQLSDNGRDHFRSGLLNSEVWLVRDHTADVGRLKTSGPPPSGRSAVGELGPPAPPSASLSRQLSDEGRTLFSHAGLIAEDADEDEDADEEAAASVCSRMMLEQEMIEEMRRMDLDSTDLSATEVGATDSTTGGSGQARGRRPR